MQKILHLAQKQGDKKQENRAYQGLSVCYSDLCQHEVAASKATDVAPKRGNKLGQDQELGDREQEGRATLQLGNDCHSIGQYQKANEYYEKAQNIALKLGDRDMEARSSAGLGSCFYNIGKYDKAIELYKKALKISEQFGLTSMEEKVCMGLGVTYFNMGQHTEATKWYQKARKVAEQLRAEGNL